MIPSQRPPAAKHVEKARLESRTISMVNANGNRDTHLLV